MTAANYSYQKYLVARVMSSLETKSQAVLAAAPGAGKTEMIMEVIRQHPGKRVLVLTHGTVSLREQTVRRFQSAGIRCAEIGTPGVDTSPNVHVGLPHAAKNLIDDFTYDLIVVDEAHHYYRGAMVQSILSANPDALQLLVTASHWWFTKTKTGGDVITLSQLELLGHGVLAEPLTKLIYTSQELRNFSHEGDLSSSDILESVDSVLKPCMKAIKASTKCIIACHNQQAARDVYNYLIQSHVVPALSTSESDVYGSALDSFISDESVQVLVVVYRGVVGFNMPELDLIVDLTCSSNVDRIFQLQGRVVRSHEGKKQPVYIKLAPLHMKQWYQHVMCGVAWLAHPKVYAEYNGRLDSLKMVVSSGRKAGTGLARTTKGTPKLPTPKIPVWRDIPRLIEAAEGCDVISLAHVRALVFGFQVNNSDENKKQLLELAASGAPRPAPVAHTPGGVLSGYTVRSSGSYDADFSSQIRNLRPDWFDRRRKDETKAELLAMASSGLPKPKKGHPLHTRMSAYLAPKGGRYDPDFRNQLFELRPDWENVLSARSGEKKAQLLQLAEQGARRPPEKKHPLGTVLSGYTTGGAECYDPEFDKEIRALRPDWFKPSKAKE